MLEAFNAAASILTMMALQDESDCRLVFCQLKNPAAPRSNRPVVKSAFDLDPVSARQITFHGANVGRGHAV